MVDYNDYLEDELAGKHVKPAPSDTWREPFEEALSRASPKVKEAVANLQEVEANLQSIARFQGKLLFDYEIREDSHLDPRCWLFVYIEDTWPKGLRRLQLQIYRGEEDEEIGVAAPDRDFYRSGSDVEQATKAAIEGLKHLA